MKKLFPFLPLLAVILACQAVTGRPANFEPTDQPVIETVPAEPTVSATAAAEPSVVEPTASPAPTGGVTIVRLEKKDGGLTEQLAAEAQKAAALGQQPVVYFDASW